LPHQHGRRRVPEDLGRLALFADLPIAELEAIAGR
jgi:hypothetical protein